MEKARNVLFKVAIIVSIVLFTLFMFLGIIFIFLGLHVPVDETTPEGKLALEIIFYVFGGLYLFFGINCFINYFVCAAARNSESKGLYIASIIFGVLSAIEINIIASIFGIILLNRKQRRKNINEE